MRKGFMKKGAFLIMAMSVLALAVAGCGDDTSELSPAEEAVVEEDTSDDAAETVDEEDTSGEDAQEVSSDEEASSDDVEGYKVTNLVGTPTDYSDENNWAHLPNNTDKPVDTFFIYPTVYINPAEDAPSIVPIDDEILRAGVAANYNNQAVIFEDLTNLYEPFYRQTNLMSVIGKNPQEFMEFQYQEQRTDVYAALDYYFENYNQGRPFILAGHSQGSMMLKIALRDYFKEHTDYLDRMVAAYVLGFSITTDDLETNPALKFAEGADDTGVIVSWNVEGPGNKNEHNAVVMENSIAINPINWKRDDTKAEASENLGDRIPVNNEQGVTVDYQVDKPGLLDAQVDTERGVVVCTTYDGYIQVGALMGDVANPFGPQSFHNMDYAGYWDNIRENVQTRIDAYLNAE